MQEIVLCQVGQKWEAKRNGKVRVGRNPEHAKELLLSSEMIANAKKRNERALRKWNRLKLS